MRTGEGSNQDLKTEKTTSNNLAREDSTTKGW